MNLRFTRRLALAAGLMLAAAPAFAQNNFSLQNLTIRDPDQKTTLVIARVEATNANLSQDELAKLFSNETADAERLAIASRLTADRILISGATISDAEAKVSLGDFEATGVDKGRFRKASLAGFHGDFTDPKKGGGGSVTGRPIELENGNLGPLLAAAQSNDLEAAAFQIGRVSWAGFDASFTDPDVSADAAGGNQTKVSLKSLTATTDYAAGAPLRSQGEATGFILEPAPSSEFGKGLRAFGYERLDLGFSAAGRYDPASRKLTIEDYTLNGAGAGRLSIAADLSGVDPAMLTASDSTQRLLAAASASVASLKVAFANQGLVEKSFAYAAAQQGKKPEALRKEASTMAAQVLPLLLGGDPSSLALAQSVQTFLANPKNFTLSLQARGEPVPLARLSAIRDPATFLALVEVRLEANK